MIDMHEVHIFFEAYIMKKGVINMQVLRIIFVHVLSALSAAVVYVFWH